jgi:hypothetical protein
LDLQKKEAAFMVAIVAALPRAARAGAKVAAVMDTVPGVGWVADLAVGTAKAVAPVADAACSAPVI